jgi:hypothetical protein
MMSSQALRDLPMAREDRPYFRECVRILTSAPLRLHPLLRGEEWLVSDGVDVHLAQLDNKHGWYCTCGMPSTDVCVYVGAILLWSLS